MKYEDLGILLTLDECKSINKAADKLFMSPTGLSKKISSLEKELGTSLLNRTAMGCELTDNGKIVLGYTKKINDLIDECKDKIKSSDTLKVRVGFSFLYDREFFKIILAANRFIDKQYFFEPVSMDNVFYEKSVENLFSCIGNSIDMLLDIEGNRNNKEYISLPIAENRICLLVPRGHKLYKKRSIKIEDLADLKILKFADGFYESADKTVKHIKDNCKNVVFEDLTDYFDSVGTYCVNNNLVFLCIDSYRSVEPNERLIPLDFSDPIPFCMIYRKDSPKESLYIINKIYKVITKRRYY